MVNFISNHFEAIISAIVGFVSGGITMHIYHKNNSDNTKTIQKNIKAGGDIAGRDIKK
jgi:hypothetical protein